MTAIGAIDRTSACCILVLGADREDTNLLEDRAPEFGWHVARYETLDETLYKLSDQELAGVEAVVLDEKLGPDIICSAIDALKDRLADAPFLLLTAGDLPDLGAPHGIAGHVRRPLSPERLLDALRDSTNRSVAHADVKHITPENLGWSDRYASLVGADATFNAALAKAAAASPGNGPILIEGEFGTGKEAVARAIHARSPRASKRLVLVDLARANCAMLESLLFGHRSGAFLGAFEGRAGVLEECNGGTVVLDQVDLMPRPVQDRLAEALHDRCVRRMGELNGSPIDVRIIALCNGSLEEKAQAGTFSEVLFGQLSSTRIWLPPLRQRRSDIPLIVREFLARQPTFENGTMTTTEDLLQLLVGCEWPGNSRQLQAALFQAIVFARSAVLSAEDFSSISAAANLPGDTLFGQESLARVAIEPFSSEGQVRPLEEIEADVIRLAIRHYKGRVTEVARRLGVGRSTLYRKLDALGLAHNPMPRRKTCRPKKPSPRSSA